jgi:inorganic pyrophosphatase/exopolyphosphatase
MKETTELLYLGNERVINTPEVVAAAFGVTPSDSSATLVNVVSRKKQFMPAMTIAIQTM